MLARAPSWPWWTSGHTNVPGALAPSGGGTSRLLAAGIGVVSTVNIQHLESLGDIVESITEG